MADAWAAEAQGRRPPVTGRVECKGRGPQRAATFDCAAAFRFAPARPAAPAMHCGGRPSPAGGVAGLWRSVGMP